MSLKLPVNGFKWIENTSYFNEDFKKTCNEESNEGVFVEIDVQHPEMLYHLYNGLLF